VEGKRLNSLYGFCGDKWEATGRESEAQRKIEKIRRQKRKRSKRAKEKMLADKRAASEKKKLRGAVNEREG